MEKRPPDTDEIISRLGELYRTDPDAFESMRKLLIERTIEGFPPQHRSRAFGLQRRLDAELGRFKDPVARMNRMVELFWEGVLHFQEIIADPEKVVRQRRDHTPAQVIPFPKKTLH